MALTRIDAYASEPQYREHIAPVFDALPNVMRGEWRRHGTNPVIVASYKDLLYVGERPVIFMEHGTGQVYGPGYPSYAGGRGRENVVLFLCPSERVADLNHQAWPAKPSVAIGCPKLDEYLNTEPEPGLIGCAWHWNANVCPESRSALPHYAGQLEGIDIGTAHPRIARAAAKVYDDAGIKFVDADEVFRRAEILVADNTSLGWEFAQLGRTVIWANAPWYRRDAHHGLRFWDQAQFMVDDPDELAKALAARPYVRTAPQYVEGRATPRGVKAIVERFGG